MTIMMGMMNIKTSQVLFKPKITCCVWVLTYLTMSLLNICTLNINGARDSVKRSLLYQLMKIKAADVMFLQETHSDPANEAEWKREWGG